MNRYILGIDQSTAGTKAVLFDEAGAIVGRSDLPHAQKISAEGWVSHDPLEIYANVLAAVRQLVQSTGVPKENIAALGISNQRETALVWNRATGLPVCDAVVWQCGRAAELCARPQIAAKAEEIQGKTGIPLSPYFSAAKIGWILENAPDTENQPLCAGTMDSWLVFKLTGGQSFKTDCSNASRTQLFNITALEWDEEICALFGIAPAMLPEVCDSNALYGHTDFEGFLPNPIPIHAVFGDSHGALFGQGCTAPGMVKATYGTGSSVMMNIGEKPVFSGQGLATSLAWRLGGRAEYVLEGNINYTGAVTKWLVDGLGLLASSKEAGPLAQSANPADSTYLVPAFTGLGAPHWDSEARAMFCGMGRGTGKAELVRAAEECIAYQIADVVAAMNRDTGQPVAELRVDGGPTRDGFLMQFQSDILGVPLSVPDAEELSVIGAAYAAGMQAGLYDEAAAGRLGRKAYAPQMDAARRAEKYAGWQAAVARARRQSL